MNRKPTRQEMEEDDLRIARQSAEYRHRNGPLDEAEKLLEQAEADPSRSTADLLRIIRQLFDYIDRNREDAYKPSF